LRPVIPIYFLLPVPITPGIIVTLIAVASILCTTGSIIALIKWKQIQREAKALRNNGSDLMQRHVKTCMKISNT